MSSSSSSDSDEDYYGPALPPGFKKTPDPAVEEEPKPTKSSDPPAPKPGGDQIGPILPPELRARLEANAPLPGEAVDKAPSEHDKARGDESGSDSDDDVIGPLPPDHPKALLRSVGPSNPVSSGDKKQKREEWMLVPPKNRIIPGLGTGPRKFLMRTPDDSKQSDEEDDEEAFAREADAEIEQKLISDYDQKMDDLKKDFEAKKRRGESLLEQHQKDMKKKKEEKAGEKKERKAFDRDTDLQITGISEGDKKKYIEKSKELNTKFSRGSRKYL